VRRTGAALAALALVVVLASPAPAANEVRTRGRRVLVDVPVEVHGADASEVIAKLNGRAQDLAEQPLFDCFPVEAIVGEGEDPHVVTIVPQRPGQFVRASAAGVPDPLQGPRQVTVGVLSLDATSPLDGPLPPLLAPEDSEAEGLHGLLLDLVRRAGVAGQLEPCARAGTLEITAGYERYHLQVTTTVRFRLTVRANGRFTVSTEPATRDAVAEDPELGHCTASDLPMFRVGVTARARGPGAEVVFTPRGREPDFTLSCPGGTIDIGGDFIRTAFLPSGSLRAQLRLRDGARRTVTGSLQGRRTTAVVRIGG
jgi:hypothetical protein